MTTPDAAALAQQAECILAMREEGARRVKAFKGSKPFPSSLPDGPHWLRYKGHPAIQAWVFLAHWSALSMRWAYFGVSGTDSYERIAAECDYIGPCITPDAQ